ncbi:MAG: phage major tail protein, TP901-1 family [Pseudomonadota bacterium]
MSGQRGRDLLIKVSNGGAFETLAGVRATRIALSAGAIDGTSAESPAAWRELVTGAGVKSAQVRGNGVFKDAASDARMRTIFFDGAIETWQLVIPGFGTLEGKFQIGELSWSGVYDGEAEFAVSLQSAGALTFEAAS